MRWRPNDPTLITNAEARVALAVVWLPRSTVRTVAEAAGCSTATAHSALRRLRDRGLLDTDDNQDGTLHALYEEVPEWAARWT